MAPGAGRRNVVVVLRKLTPLEVSLAEEGEIGGLAPQVNPRTLLLQKVFVVIFGSTKDGNSYLEGERECRHLLETDESLRKAAQIRNRF